MRDTNQMIAGMAPRLQPGAWYFCKLDAGDRRLNDLVPKTLGMFREPEAVSLVLSDVDMKAAGLDGEGPMAWLQLDVMSALDGVGLTAAVSAALSEAGIPANVVAAYHHDHVFVPHELGPKAVAALEQRAREA